MSRLATGSVYQIKTGKHAGKWAAAVTLPGGKRRTRHAKTAQEAEQHRRAMLADIDSGAGLRANSRLTVAEHLKNWLLYTVRPSVRPSTFESYQHKLAMLIPLIGSKSLDKLEPNDIRAAYARLAAKGHPAPSVKRKPKRDENGKVAGLSPTSIKNAHVALKSALKQAHRDGLVRRNVADLVTAPRSADFEPNPLTADEARKLLAAIDGHRHGPLWTLMLTSGIRIGEAAGLVWDDIDFGKRSIAIRFTLTRPLVKPGQRRWERTRPKTRKSRRVLALGEMAAEALRKQRAQNAREQLAAPEWTDEGFVFPNTTGGPIRANHVLVAWHKTLTAADLAPRRLHDLRASAATLLFGDGMSARAIADLLGHSSTGMTDRYIGAAPEIMRRMASAMDGILMPGEDDGEPEEAGA